jgi:rhomboid family GlyGly-CTERM serine protease
MPQPAQSPDTSRRRAIAFAVGFVLWTVAAQAWSDHIAGLQFDRTRFEAGAVWTLLTAQWVHFGTAHAALNAAMLVLMVLALHGWVSLRMQWVALVGGFLGVAIAIAQDPYCQYYAGASGALHGLWAGSAMALLLPRGQERHRGGVWLGAGMVSALVIKLVWQALLGSHSGDGGESVGWQVLVGVPIYYPAHVAGALGGAAAVLLVAAFLRCLRR